jgi:hypothetical protein
MDGLMDSWLAGRLGGCNKMEVAGGVDLCVLGLGRWWVWPWQYLLAGLAWARLPGWCSLAMVAVAAVEMGARAGHHRRLQDSFSGPVGSGSVLWEH